MTRQGERGFTLLETLVALTVFALVAAGLQMCLSRGWSGVSHVSKQKAALQLASAKLAAAGLESALIEGTAEGATADGFAWSRTVTRHQADDGEGLADPRTIVGYWVKVAVTWRDGPGRSDRRIELTTLKIGRRGE